MTPAGGRVADFVIDEEFRRLIPPIAPDEKRQLEENILAEGCRDPLAVWFVIPVNGHHKCDHVPTQCDLRPGDGVWTCETCGYNPLPFETVLLDGHNRFEICQKHGIEFDVVEIDLPNRDAALDWIDRNQIGRRNLKPDQLKVIRGRRYNRLKKSKAEAGAIGGSSKGQGDPCLTESTADRLAREHGVSPKTIKRDAAVVKILEEHPEKADAVIAGKLSISKAKKEIAAEQRKSELAKAQKSISVAKRKSIESVCDLRVSTCRDLFASGVKPDAVITDPPYPREFLHCFTELAEGCKLAGVPVVAVMSGQSYLPEVMERLCEHLPYRWTMAYLTPGGQAVQQWQAKVNTTWKPVLVFGQASEWFGDVAASKANDNDKRFHGWGQSESGFADLVERLTKPGQLVCDPFMGAGTTAAVCLAMGRRFVGCDIDEKHVEQARARAES